jgi:hypothetical protein
LSDDYEQDDELIETTEKETDQQPVLPYLKLDTERTFEGNPSDRMEATLKEKAESEKSLKLESDQTKI